MAKIGTRACYHNGNSCGHVQNVNVSFTFKELGRLKKNRKVFDSATITITSVGDHSDNIFETSGPLRWCTTEIFEQGNVIIFCNELPNVTLHKSASDDNSSETDSIDVTMEEIEGDSWSCPTGIIKTQVDNYLDAEYFCQHGYLPNVEGDDNGNA